VDVNADGSLVNRGTHRPCGTEKEYTPKELNGMNVLALKKVIVEEVEEHECELGHYTTELTSIEEKLETSKEHFAKHETKHLVAIILSQQTVEEVVDFAENLLEEEENVPETTSTTEETHYTAKQLETKDPAHTEEQHREKLVGIIEVEIRTHNAELKRYKAELKNIESKLGGLDEKDLIAVILAQQAVEAMVDTAQHLVEEVKV